jgi:hypothetical protein
VRGQDPREPLSGIDRLGKRATVPYVINSLDLSTVDALGYIFSLERVGRKVIKDLDAVTIALLQYTIVARADFQSLLR